MVIMVPKSVGAPLRSMVEKLLSLERLTRPVHPDTEAALERRWQELPDHVKTPAQLLGRRTGGCEGTHGVFPRCNLACTPCYHSRDANKVRIDGTHTLGEVDRQMAFLRQRRGPGQHAQLIGGEVTLLGPDDHGAALAAMERHGRKPMSMSHGDFDYSYLKRLALDETGRRRFKRLSFAGHFDSTMYGRRGIERVDNERDLNPYRKRFCEMFEKLRREHGVDYYLAHNMTVTPSNVDDIPALIRDCRHMGFRMFSFQPAASVGNEKRWKEDYRALTSDAVWSRIEEGAGTRLPHRAIQIGDTRCNRTVWGAYVGDRWIPAVDDRLPRDLEARDAFFSLAGGMDFGTPRPLLAVKLLRAATRRPRTMVPIVRWVLRLGRRAGFIAMMRHGVRPMTFVMHSFMDAADVGPAWEMLKRGETSDDPRIRETQERLSACAYEMAQPGSNELVPACVQHSVLDPRENLALHKLLPLAGRPQRRADA